MSSPFFRFEFKYVIPEALMKAIEADLLGFGMKRDAAGNHYTVNSLYFDNPFFSDYNDKSGGFLRRKKVRVRIYGESLNNLTDPRVWLELKEKYDMRISKRRVAVSREDWKHFPAILKKSHYSTDAFTAQEKQVFGEFKFEMISGTRIPSVLVSYSRSAFTKTIAGQKVRITLDYGLKAARPSLDLEMRNVRKVMAGWAVLEVKYDRFLPAYITVLIQKYGLRREAYSKYAKGLETINRYNPLPK